MSDNYKNIDGYVYVIETDYGCKIGYSTMPTHRIRQIESMSPVPFLRTYISCLIPDVMNMEAKLHRMFNSKRIKYEWFNESFDKILKTVKAETAKYEKYQLNKLLKASERLGEMLNER